MSEFPNLPHVKLQFPEWQLEYQEALFELDSAKLPERVNVAASALLKRVHALPPDASRERQKIEDALSNLRLLMRMNKAA